MKIDKLIGNTPMVKIKCKYKNEIKYIYAKLEYYNYTGSIKDRVINYIIKDGIKNNKLIKGMPIIEATSGNTGISLSALGRLYNHKVYIFMPDWVSHERYELMKLYGANIKLITKEEGGFKEAIKQAIKLKEQTNGFLTNQFSNDLNIKAHYETTGNEIIKQTPNIDAFVCGIGTGGTLMGVGKRLKEYNKNIKLIALEPDKMPLLSKNEIIDEHKIEGIGDDFIPELVDKKMIDDVILINDMDAINMSRKLALKFGLGVGISSGANFLASILSGYKNVVTIFADDSKKYLSTDLTKKNKNKKFISNEIKLISLECIN